MGNERKHPKPVTHSCSVHFSLVLLLLSQEKKGTRSQKRRRADSLFSSSLLFHRDFLSFHFFFSLHHHPVPLFYSEKIFPSLALLVLFAVHTLPFFTFACSYCYFLPRGMHLKYWSKRVLANFELSSSSCIIICRFQTLIFLLHILLKHGWQLLKVVN